LKILVILVIAWFLLAYLILPALWRHYEHQPALEDAPRPHGPPRASPATRSTSA
jgi:hypothetical protein